MLRQWIYLIVFLLGLAVPCARAAESEKDQRKFDYFFYEGLSLKNAGKFDAAFDAFNSNATLEFGAAMVSTDGTSFSDLSHEEFNDKKSKGTLA